MIIEDVRHRLGNPFKMIVLTVAFALALGWPAPVRADDRPIVGAIRWDAWYGDGGPVAQVERSLGPRRFHFRLPFFARVLADDKVRINGNAWGSSRRKSPMPPNAGLNYWAFVDYGDKGDLTIARHRYQAARDKRGLRFCFIEEGSRIDGQGTAAGPV